MEKENQENSKQEPSANRPEGKDIWDIFAKPIPMKWIILFIAGFLCAYTYFRLTASN